jgi:hypothetical protein
MLAIGVDSMHDMLPGVHEYQEQVESKTAAMMSRKCANLDKQKMSGPNKCKKLHCLGNSEVLAQMYSRVVRDSKMQSDMDRYEGRLQLTTASLWCGYQEGNVHSRDQCPCMGPVIMGFGPCGF